MSKHTTLPWVCGDNGLIYGQCSAAADEAPCIADVITDRERAVFGIMTDAEHANAALIVEACNRYAELVALLRQAYLLCATRRRVSRLRKQKLATAMGSLLSEIDDASTYHAPQQQREPA